MIVSTARFNESLVNGLTPRRRAVLELLAKGLTNEEIGRALQISSGTARTHVAAVLAELEVSNRTEAAALYAAVAARPAHVAQVLARPAIAVLPLEVLDPSPRAARVAAGLTHDLAVLFSRWTWFPVIALISSSTARAGGGTLGEIGARIGARFLVDGTLGCDRAGWRLVMRLDDAESGRCLWTERYNFADGALFEAQDEICAAIVAAGYQVMVAHAQRPARTPLPQDLTAWELAHEGMALQARRERSAHEQAVARFRAALAREPGLVLAWFGLGLCQFDEALNQWGDKDAACDAIAACAERCLELAPHAAEGHFLLGRLCQMRGDPSRGVQPLEAAIGRNPSFAACHSLLGQVLLLGGRMEEGIARMRHAARLGPGAFVAGLAVAHFLRGENAEALEAAERALLVRPGYTFARVIAAASAWWLGDAARAGAHAVELKRRERAFERERFLETFGAQVEGVHRIFTALRALDAG